MLRNENIICISSIDWDFVWQGHQEIMATFARNGNRVLFIENTGVRVPGIRDASRIKKRVQNWLGGVKGIRQETHNLYVYSPLVLPFPYSRIARWLNCRLMLPALTRWMKIMDFTDPIIWTFLPTGTALEIIEEIDKKLAVYYCIADFEKLVPDPRKVRRTEKEVIRKSDVVFVQGEFLRERCAKYSDNVSIFPFGVNTDVFSRASAVTERPTDIKDIKGPILGYVGGIHRHIDFKLVEFLAERNPDWTLVFIGPLQTDISEFEDMPNVVFLKAKEHRDLGNYVGAFTVCLIPYALNEYTATVYPTKLSEYLAMGKAVVSTPLPEVLEFNRQYSDIVYVGSSNEEFEALVKKVLYENNPAMVEKRLKAAGDNNWGARIGEMSDLIQEALEKKKAAAEKGWKENLVNFYRVAREKAVRMTVLCAIAYFVLFKTSFLWFMAGPLKISQLPQKADAIVVFGGGVGETGSPGKSTIERARYAAQLYQEGYAKKIIFSSGYTYFYNDGENMKLLAVSMGVPERDIILEERANSTYENVVFSKQILDQNKWDSIILVSSPYNMKRAQLVFKKWSGGVKVNYASVEKCQFYDRTKGLKLEQLKGFIHEYLGIVYYWLKGHI